MLLFRYSTAFAALCVVTHKAAFANCCSECPVPCAFSCQCCVIQQVVSLDTRVNIDSSWKQRSVIVLPFVGLHSLVIKSIYLAALQMMMQNTHVSVHVMLQV